MIAAILTLATQPQTVTFTHPCASSSVVLQKLGEQIGTRLEPGGSVNSDFFLVSFTDVPVQEALDKIATTLNATWEEKSGVKYLTRTKAQELNEEKEERALDIKLIEDWLAKREVKEDYTVDFARKLIERALPLMKSDQNQFNPEFYQQLADLNLNSPLERLLTRLLKEIGAAAISDVGDMGEVQYVLDPSPVQRRLPNAQAMKLYVKEQETHLVAIQESGAIDRAASSMYYSPLVSPYIQRYSFSSSRTLLTVSKEMGYYRIVLEMEKVGQAQAAIPVTERGGAAVPEVLSGQQDKYEPPSIESQMSKAVFAIFDGRGVKPEVTSELRDILIDPVKNEPLATFGSKWMVEASAKLGRNVVALLSDDASFASTVMLARNMTNFGQMWSVLPEMDKGYKITVDDKWITLRPAKPVQVRSERVDREKWRSILAVSRREQSPSIETYAAFAGLSDNDLLVMLSLVPAILLGNDVSLDAIQQGDGVASLRLFGSLSAAQQRAAHGDGAELSLARLTPRQAKSARKLLFSSKASLSPEPRQEMWDEANVSYGKTIETDPAAQLGAGVPNGSVVRFRIIERTLFYPRPEQGSVRSHGYQADRIAQNIAAAEFYPEHQWGDFSYLAPARAEQLVLEFAFPSVGFVYRRVQIDRLPKDIVYKRLSELPDEVRGEIEAALKIHREAYRKGKEGGGGGG